MILQSYKLIDFNERIQSSVHKINVPSGSIFRKAVVLNDGIFLWYENPTNIISITGEPTFTEETEIFVILKTGETIPEGTEFVDILNTDFLLPLEPGETEAKQAVMIFPLYKVL